MKRFGDAKKRKTSPVSEFEIWLFPNFGKRGGFGEPDAILIADKHVFWIEVETIIDCQKSAPALRKSLLQLRRFRLFQDALARGPSRAKGAKRILGTTIGNDGQRRDASIKLADHGVLKELLPRLRAVGIDANDHYVLFTINKPRGPGKGNSYADGLASTAKILNEDGPGVASLPMERCWYAYWKGDLESKVERLSGCRFALDDQYVRIKRRKSINKRPKVLGESNSAN